MKYVISSSIAVAATTILCLAIQCRAEKFGAPSHLFSSSSPWRQPVGFTHKIKQSDAILNALKQRRPEGLTINTDAWTPAVIYAGPGANRQDFAWSEWIMPSVPINLPLFTAVEYFKKVGDTDASVCLFDQERSINYSLYGLRRSRTTNLLSITAGGAFRNSGSGWWSNVTQPWAGRASGGAQCGGLVLASELRTGSVQHALAVGLPRALILKSSPAFPATTSDGTCVDPSSCVAMGSRIQLDPKLSTAELRKLGLTEPDIVVAKSWQTYGAYVVDSSGTFSLYIENGLGSGHSKYGLSKVWPAAIFSDLSILANHPDSPLESRQTMKQYVRRKNSA